MSYLIPFALVYLLLVMQRLGELWLAKRHEKILRAQGAVEFGARHYPWLVGLHVLWFIGMPLEAWLHFGARAWPTPSFLWLILWAVCQPLRYWIISSLDKNWTTRVLVVPGSARVRRGPYRYLNHPNYLVVAVELLAVPMAFSLPITAILALVNHALLMLVRIPIERRALQQLCR